MKRMNGDPQSPSPKSWTIVRRVGWAYTKVQSAWLKGFAQCVTGVTDALGRFWQNQTRNQKEEAMNTKHRHHSVARTELFEVVRETTACSPTVFYGLIAWANLRGHNSSK
jgi:hypothetical protein